MNNAPAEVIPRYEEMYGGNSSTNENYRNRFTTLKNIFQMILSLKMKVAG